MDISRTGAQNENLSTLEHITMSTYGMAGVRATADGGAGLAGDPKLNIFTEQLLQIAHLAGDPKRQG